MCDHTHNRWRVCHTIRKKKKSKQNILNNFIDTSKCFRSLFGLNNSNYSEKLCQHYTSQVLGKKIWYDFSDWASVYIGFFFSSLPTVMPKWVTYFLVLINNGGHKDFIVLFLLHRNCCRQWLVLKFMFNVFSVLPLDICTEHSLQSALLASFNHEIHPDHHELVAFVH